MQTRRFALVAAVATALLAAVPATARAGGPSPSAAQAARSAGVWVEGWSAAASVKADLGGDLVIPGVVRVHIPEGALPRDMIIYVRAEVVHAGGQAFLAFTFGPSGTVFRRPLTVTVSPRLIRGLNVHIGTVWYDAGTNPDGTLAWVPTAATVGTGPADDPDGLFGERYTFEVFHFSRYALGSITYQGKWW